MTGKTTAGSHGSAVPREGVSLAEMQRLARRLSGERWRLTNEREVAVGRSQTVATYPFLLTQRAANRMALIAACSPERILALTEAVEAARALLTDMDRAVARVSVPVGAKYRIEVPETGEVLRAALDAFTADAPASSPGHEVTA